MNDHAQSITRTLYSLQDTEALGAELALHLSQCPCSLLMQGPLGAGKTSLVRALVRHLPGGSEAEVSSPSFTIFNLYPTYPQIVHCDLYRCGQGSRLPDEAWDVLDNGALLVCEWSEYLDPADAPSDSLLLTLTPCTKEGKEHVRTLIFRAHGPNAERVLARMREKMERQDGCEC